MVRWGWGGSYQTSPGAWLTPLCTWGPRAGKGKLSPYAVWILFVQPGRASSTHPLSLALSLSASEGPAPARGVLCTQKGTVSFCLWFLRAYPPRAWSHYIPKGIALLLWAFLQMPAATAIAWKSYPSLTCLWALPLCWAARMLPGFTAILSFALGGRASRWHTICQWSH